MKQVAQRPRDGHIQILEVPLPSVRPGWVLVANRCSLISSGTERTKIELGGKTLVKKARARPDLVRKVVARARAEGIRPAISVARDRLDALVPLGYSSAGIVLSVGPGVEGLVPGDRVACGGGGYANHAEVVAVPKNLVARIPDGVPFEAASYATVGAVALHSIRQAEAKVGEHVGVIGLGLVGQLGVRILAAAGCFPIGIDLEPSALALATAGGARTFDRSEPGLEAAVLSATGGLGLDSVVICAATSSADPVELAAVLARDRGRIVLVGEVPVQASRALFYEKELELRLSRSYGPGRYDRDYEERGRDLPPGYVRWTEQRNLDAFLGLVARDKLDPSTLTTHRFAVEHAADAYASLTDNGEPRPFGIVLEYSYEERSTVPQAKPARTRKAGKTSVGVIGAGSFARRTLIPALKKEGAEIVAVATEGGLTAADVASRFSFGQAAVSADEILADTSIEAVVVATRHASHASFAAGALRAGKAVFVEKPLALDHEGLLEVEAALSPGALLMVGYNRRFAPLVERLRAELEGVAARALLVRVNAGPLPEEHWLHDPEEGGGRLLGETCHFVDLLAHLAGARPVSAYAVAVPHPVRGIEQSDDVVGTLRFANGGVGTLLYTGSGDSRLSKERVEAYGGGLAAVLDDFRRLELYRGGKRAVFKSGQDKGHRAEIKLFLDAVRGEAAAPPIESYLNSTCATFALAQSLRSGSVVELA
jgi:predicted dehydrogenase/threonine dehydrogenase-like Zn-dependent dehydrogenase